jgi:ribosomal protein S8E
MEFSFRPQPKPTRKDRPSERRKRERKKRDAELQRSVSGYGICENCTRWRFLGGHHKKKRRFIATRWDRANIMKVCWECNVDFESLSAKQLMKKYPFSPLFAEWAETDKRGKLGLS